MSGTTLTGSNGTNGSNGVSGAGTGGAAASQTIAGDVLTTTGALSGFLGFSNDYFFGLTDGGGAGGAGGAGTDGQPGTVTQISTPGLVSYVWTNAGDGTAGGLAGNGGGAITNVASNTIGSALTTAGGSIGIYANATGGFGGGGGIGGNGGATGTTSTGPGSQQQGGNGGNGAPSGTAGAGGNANSTITNNLVYGGGNIVLSASATGGGGGSNVLVPGGSGGEGALGGLGAAGGAGGAGGNGVAAITGNTLTTYGSISISAAATGSQGGPGAAAGTGAPGVIFGQTIVAANGISGAGGADGNATAVIDNNNAALYDSSFSNLSITASALAYGAALGGGDPTTGNLFAGAIGAPGAVGSESLELMNNVFSLNAAFVGQSDTMTLNLSLTEGATSLAAGHEFAGLVNLNGAAGGNLTFVGNQFQGSGNSTLNLLLAGTGGGTVDSSANKLFVAGSAGNAITGFTTFDLAKNFLFVAGSGSYTVQLNADPDTVEVTPTSGGLTLTNVTTADLMLDFNGFSGLTSGQVLAGSTIAGGNTTISVPGGAGNIVLSGYTTALTASLISFGAPACYAAGSRIATVSGEIAVEDLREGDLVLTHQGVALPMRWLGHRDVDCRHHPDPLSVLPIRVAAHAFGPGLPARDLVLSPDHAIFAEGVLIPVKLLLNGSSVALLLVESVTYYHVELDRHAVILAEGLPAESYLETGNRGSFSNGGGATTLHPSWTPHALRWEAAGAATLCLDGPILERVRAHLYQRSLLAA